MTTKNYINISPDLNINLFYKIITEYRNGETDLTYKLKSTFPEIEIVKNPHDNAPEAG